MKSFIEYIKEMKINSQEYKDKNLQYFRDRTKKWGDKLKFDENKKIFTKQKLYRFDVKKLYVGYWANEYSPWYGIPEPNWEGWENEKLYNEFLDKLNKKMEKSGKLGHFCGYSDCRICGKSNGTGEYRFDDKRNGDEISLTVMPIGYFHYIKEHKIKPHKWFLEYIINS